MVQNTDYGYLVVGEAQDTTGVNARPLLTIGYDFEGDTLFLKEYATLFDYTNPIVDTDARLNDSTLLVATEYILYDNDTLYCLLIWMNNDGDTLQARKFSSPYYYFSNDPENYSYWMRPASITVSDDEQYIYLVCRVIDYPPIQNSFIVKKLTAQGDEVWTYHQPFNDNYSACNVVQYFDDNPWIAVEGWGGGSNYNKVIKLNDETGENELEIELVPGDYLLNNSSDMLISSEGVVIAAKKMMYDDDGNAVNAPAIYKMDYEGNYIWHAEVPNGYRPGQSNEHVVQAPDGGYVCCALRYDTINETATIDTYNEYWRLWLWKVDANGNYLWERKYAYITSDSSSYFLIYNYPHDMKATPDGGVIVAGEATVICTDYPTCDNFTQQGWLLKVDGCGCLVPGCDQNCVVGIQEFNDSKIQVFKVGPSPTSDLLNVYIAPLESLNIESLNLECRNMQGQLVKTFSLRHTDTTYMIDTSSLAAGQYVLSLTSEGQVLQTEKVIVQK